MGVWKMTNKGEWGEGKGDVERVKELCKTGILCMREFKPCHSLTTTYLHPRPPISTYLNSVDLKRVTEVHEPIQDVGSVLDRAERGITETPS
uniref:Uncharacterized protein n=1 Tax=Vespula pensylvanica TaxID=30213 RepID=A0A834PGA6_VESPE|nr:hypothetical protein H0235_001540 [Vespula pensylvanica]